MEADQLQQPAAEVSLSTLLVFLEGCAMCRARSDQMAVKTDTVLQMENMQDNRMIEASWNFRSSGTRSAWDTYWRIDLVVAMI